MDRVERVELLEAVAEVPGAFAESVAASVEAAVEVLELVGQMMSGGDRIAAVVVPSVGNLVILR